MEKRVTFNERWLPYLLLGPQMIITLVFFFWPSGQAIYQSVLIEDAFGGNTKFVFLDNFIHLFNDPGYYHSARLTVVFSFLVAAVGLALSLLLAVIVLYMLPPSVFNLVIVLSITRIPVYLRTTRAEVLEIRERMFIQAAKVMGASNLRIIFRQILPVVAPTILTIATLDFAFVMLAESSLSFLGIGIQPPEITWGLMVSQGRPYLTTAGWLAFWPGLAIILTTLSLNLLSNWMRIALDPVQRWRLEKRAKTAKEARVV